MAKWWKRRPAVPTAIELSGSPAGIRLCVVGKSRVEIGRLTYGIEGLQVKEWGEGAALRIGAFCSIAPVLTVFLGGNHRMDWSSTYPFGQVLQDYLTVPPIQFSPLPVRDVTIGNDVWIGSNVTVMSGANVSDGAVIAANSTVTRNVGPYEIWGGNPAQFIRARFAPEIARRLHATRWWECAVETIRELAPLLSQPPGPEVLDRIEDLVRCDRQKKDGPGEPGPSQG